MQTQATPRIFVSHSHTDNAWCQQFVEALRRRGADIWFDQQNLRRGMLWKTIGSEMETRPIFILVSSPEAFRSGWVDNEVGAALNLQARDPHRVILPVIAHKCKVPPFLGAFSYVGNEGEDLTPEAAADEVARRLDFAPLPVSEPTPAPDAIPSPSVPPQHESEPPPGTRTEAHHHSLAASASEPKPEATGTPQPAVPETETGSESATAAAPLVADRSSQPDQRPTSSVGEALPPLFRYSVTDIYDEQRRRFLVQYPLPLVVGLALSGVLVFALTGFFGYRDSLESHTTAAIFRAPWPLFLWLCALLVVLEVSVLRAPSQRGRLGIVLLVTLVSMVLAGAAYTYAELPAFAQRLLSPLSLGPSLVASSLTYSVLNFGALGIFTISSFARWVQRARMSRSVPADEVPFEQDRARSLPSLQSLVAGDLLALGVLALLLSVLMQPAAINAAVAVLQVPVHVTSCTLALPPGGPCAASAGGIASFMSLSGIDLVLSAICLEHVLVILALALGSGDLRAQVILDTLRSAVNRHVRLPLGGLVLSLRNIGWPLLIFVSVLSVAAASRSIQTYLHLQSDRITCHDVTTCGGESTYIVVHAQLASFQQYQALGLAILSLGIAALALFFALGLLLFRWRVVDNSLRFTGWIALVWLMTDWVFALGLSALNALVSLAGLSARVPFPQPEPLTVMSFAALVVFTAITLTLRWRRGRSLRAD